MADTSRVIVCSPQDAFVAELQPDQVFELLQTEEVNGEHSLSITTSHVLAKGMRILTLDGTGRWREHVVMGEDADHASGKRPLGTYYAIWSLQYDLMGVTSTVMPGTQTPVTASTALEALLGNTSRWVRGTVTQATTGGASMWRMSAWQALGVLVDVWGGEVEPTITVSGTSVTGRAVNLYAHQGSATATRRFDYTRDLASIRRKVAEDAMYVRIIPLGKGQESEGGGYGRKIDITSVNGGVEWLENTDVKDVYKLPDGSGGWEYPTGYVENSKCETPADLKAWGLSVLEAYTTPKVTYEADVIQFAEAGMDIQGLALGDAVNIVDRAFGDSGIRITGRVLKLVTNLADPEQVGVTVGNLTEGLPDVIGDLGASVSKIGDGLARTNAALYETNQTAMTTADYISNIIDNLNDEINVGGGFAYIVPGHGIVTYNCAVADPLVATEASTVTQIKGGAIRIANSKQASFSGINDWNWKTVIVSGHIATELVTAAHLTAGYIGSAASGNYWDLDSGTLRIAASSTVGGKAIATQDAVIADVDVEYAKNSSSTTAPTSGWSTTAPTWESGKYVWQRTKTVSQSGATAYSAPTCIQGAKGADGSPGTPGADGDDGVGVSAIVEQYYLSTSSTTQTGGSWSTNQPAWVSGKYIWTRSRITWTNGTTTNTSPVLAKAINGANESASSAQTTANSAAAAAADAEKVATNYLAFDNNGLCVGDMTASTLGRNINISSTNIDVRNGTTILARFAAKLVELGRNATDAVIKFCGGKASISASTTGGVTVSSFEAENAAIRGKSGTKTAHAVFATSNEQPMITLASTDTSLTPSASSMVIYNDHFSVSTSEFALNTGKLNLNTGVNMVSRCSSPTSWTTQYGIYAYRNQAGIVSLYCVPSVVPGGSPSTTRLCTLPVGWRPYQNQYQRTYCGGWCVVQVNTDGNVYFVRQETTVADTLYVCMSFPALNLSAV